MISRQARISLIEETVNAVGADHQDRRPMRWRGEDVPWPVVQIPVSHALLNPYSHRIKAQIGSLGLSGQVIADDPFGDEAQEFIAEIVCGTPGYARIKATLARDKQQDPGVMTREGVLINANTRLVALRELGVPYIKVQVLPTDATQAELTELELGFQDPAGPDLVDQAIDARPGTAKLSGQHLDRDTHPVAAINLTLCFLVQGSRSGGEDCPVRMLPVVGLQGQPNCFRGTCHLACDPPRDLDQTDLAWAVKSHPTGSADNFVPLCVGQLPKS